MKRLDREVLELAGGQHGAVGHRQVLDVGGSPSAARRRLVSGDWLRSRLPGVLVLPAFPDTWEQRLWVAHLWGGPASAVSHRAAAALWGLDRFGPGPVELTVPRGSKHRARGLLVHQADLGPAERRTVDGLAVVSPELTLLGCAAASGARDDAIDDAMESAFRLGLTTPDRLLDALDGRPGSAMLRRLLRGRAAGRARDSRLEGELLRLVRAAGLSEPVRQHEVVVGRERFFLDFAYPQRRLAIELDGFAKLDTRAGRQAFLTRQTKLVLAGWTLLRFSWDDVVHRPHYVLSCIRSALAAA